MNLENLLKNRTSEKYTGWNLTVGDIISERDPMNNNKWYYKITERINKEKFKLEIYIFDDDNGKLLNLRYEEHIQQDFHDFVYVISPDRIWVFYRKTPMLPEELFNV